MTPAPHNNQLHEGFAVPEGYFDAARMKLVAKAAWQSELDAYPLLASVEKRNTNQAHPTAATDDLFDKTLLSELYALRSNTVFEVPENYFEQQASHLTLELPSVWLGIPNPQTAFTLPEEYFEQSATKITGQINKEAKGRVISMFRMSSLAAAAILVVVISVLGYRIYNQPVIEGDCGTIACLEKTELLKAKAIETIDNESLYELVNPSDLELQLNGAPNSQEDSSSELDAWYEEELNS